jgi:hypothetical protein
VVLYDYRVRDAIDHLKECAQSLRRKFQSNAPALAVKEATSTQPVSLKAVAVARSCRINWSLLQDRALRPGW